MVGTSAGFEATLPPQGASAGALPTAGARAAAQASDGHANAAVGAGLGSTLDYRYQLAGHVARIEAATYNSRRHHVLTADASSLRLWSLRKELRRVPTPCTDGLRHALTFVCVSRGIASRMIVCMYLAVSFAYIEKGVASQIDVYIPCAMCCFASQSKKTRTWL